MQEIYNLAVEIGRDSITIIKPRTDQHVTYSKDPTAPLLVANDALREALDALRAASASPLRHVASGVG